MRIAKACGVECASDTFFDIKNPKKLIGLFFAQTLR
jgi:hypothetical protein